MKDRANIEYQYLQLLRDLTLFTSNKKDDRTGVGTHSIFGKLLRHDMATGFPLLTTKDVWFRGVFEELMWFLNGDTDVRNLKAKNVNIWNDDFYKHYLKTAENPVEQKDFDYDMPNTPIYGHQWRNLKIDQIKRAIELLKTDPNSRKNIVSSWNVEQISEMVLEPCHVMFQLYTRDGTKFENCEGKKVVSLMWYQRSADCFLGLPFNIASYALLLELIADHCGMVAGDLIVTIGDAHIYNNHLEAVEKQLKNIPKLSPRIKIKNKRENIWDYQISDIEIIGYENCGKIFAKLNT